jgi:hypothetical protein
LDYAYHQLLQHMDNGSRRFAKCYVKKIGAKPSEIDYKAEFMKLVLKKGHTNPSAAALNLVRDRMRLLYSSEQEIFSQFQIYFDENDTNFATQFKSMLEDECNSNIIWMKDSLIPFGKELLNWSAGVLSDGDEALEESLYLCNGNLHFCI